MAENQLRVGADVTRVDDVAASVERFGSRYLHRVYTDHEISSSQGPPTVMAAKLAARFAAKEAVIKVLRPEGVTPTWTSMEVRRHPEGWCEMRLAGEAARQAAEVGITDMAVSITHEGSYAGAVVVAMCAPGGATR